MPVIVTMRDVAREAGVSQSTVSLVLNGKTGAQIPDTTREKVLAAAVRLGYSRNALAVSMKTGKSKVVGLVGGLYSGYSLDMLKGVGSRAAASGYALSIIPMENESDFTASLELCAGQRVAGALVCAPPAGGVELALKRLGPLGIPVVALLGSGECSSVSSDDRVGAEAATDHLLALGHRRIVFVGRISARREGFAASLRRHGVDVQEWMFVPAVSGESVRRLLREDGATAAFCATDPTAMQLLQAVHALGARVPDDLSVAGFAGTDCSALASPPLTTVKQAFQEMGKTAFDILLGHINGDTERHVVKVTTELIVRESTKAL